MMVSLNNFFIIWEFWRVLILLGCGILVICCWISNIVIWGWKLDSGRVWCEGVGAAISWSTFNHSRPSHRCQFCFWSFRIWPSHSQDNGIFIHPQSHKLYSYILKKLSDEFLYLYISTNLRNKYVNQLT